jgi:hypothetical protein
MTQSGWMKVLCACLGALLLPGPARPQSAEEIPPVSGAHPRIFLTARRLKLLRRERQRQSLRWNQFELLLAGKAPMPEPGFAYALYYQVSGDAAAGRQAVTWALGPGADLRQLALVFDWCQELLTEAQSKSLAAKLAGLIQSSRRDASFAAVRSRALAAVALAGQAGGVSSPELHHIIRQWWEAQTAPKLDAGRQPPSLAASYALFELLHVLRDNLDLDLREAAPRFFHDLAFVHLLSCYPATYAAGENQFRIPATLHPGEPDLRAAALARAAELSMVAFDPNAPGVPFLQGWLMNDNFLLRGAFGIPYEFLWANPYQPGLSYHHAPRVLHDELFGRLFVRSSWDESASWLGLFGGQLQLFQDGRVRVLDPQQDGAPLMLDAAVVLFGAHTRRFKVIHQSNEPVFVVGLRPQQNYRVEWDHHKTSKAETDGGGILPLDLPPKTTVGVRLSISP